MFKHFNEIGVETITNKPNGNIQVETMSSLWFLMTLCTYVVMIDRRRSKQWRKKKLKFVRTEMYAKLLYRHKNQSGIWALFHSEQMHLKLEALHWNLFVKHYLSLISIVFWNISLKIALRFHSMQIRYLLRWVLIHWKQIGLPAYFGIVRRSQKFACVPWEYPPAVLCIHNSIGET